MEPLKALAARTEVDGSKLAAIGFCFGGTMAYELALAGADIKAAVGFHSGLKVTSPGDAHQIKAKVLTMVGADDPSIPVEARDGFAKMLERGEGRLYPHRLWRRGAQLHRSGRRSSRASGFRPL